MSNAYTQISEEDKRIKGSNRIQINNNLTAVSMVILSLLLATEKISVSIFAICQLAIAIPCLATSSLAYAKLCYRERHEYLLWNGLAWFTHSVGYLAILNTFAIILYRSNYINAAWLFLIAIALLHLLYTIVNIASKKGRWMRVSIKLLFYFTLLIVGSVFPILYGW